MKAWTNFLRCTRTFLNWFSPGMKSKPRVITFEYLSIIAFAYRQYLWAIEHKSVTVEYEVISEPLERVRRNTRYWLSDDSRSKVISSQCETKVIFFMQIISAIQFPHWIWKRSVPSQLRVSVEFAPKEATVFFFKSSRQETEGLFLSYKQEFRRREEEDLHFA